MTAPARPRPPAGRKDLLTLAEVLSELDVPKSTFFRWKAIGKAPRTIKYPNASEGDPPVSAELLTPLPDEMLTIEEAAARIKMSVRYVRRLIAERRIPFHRLGRAVRIHPADLAAFVEAGRVEPINPGTVWSELRRVA